MKLFLSLLLIVCTYSLSAEAHPSRCQTAEDCALEETLDYCYEIYGRSRSAYSSCHLAAAKTYEHILSEEATDFSTICKPYFLDACDSGRKIFLAKLKLRK